MGFKQFIEESKKAKAYVMDVDDTLITSNAKIKVLDKSGEDIKSLTPQEYSTYKLKNGEQFDFSEFRDKKVLVTTAKKTDYWQVAQNVNDAVKRGDSTSVLYILTARPDAFKKDLYNYLKSSGLDTLKMNNVYTVGDRGADLSVAQLKKISLKHIKKKHSEVSYFDDDTKNIELANELKTIKARQVK